MPMSTVHAAINAFAESTPERIALIDEQRQLSYRQLADEVERLADWLSALGLRRVGLWGDNGSPWIVADLAAWRAGVTLIPLPRFFSESQLRHVIDSADIEELLVCGDVADVRPVASRRATPARGIHLDRLVRDHNPVGVDAGPNPTTDGVCKITYTSGTTGSPKGVCLSSAQVERVTAALAEAICAADDTQALERHFNLLPLSTLLENIAGVYVPLLLGRTVVSLPGDSTGLLGSSQLDMPRLLQALSRYRPSSLIVLPQILAGLVAAAGRGARLPDSLRFMAVGGSVTPVQLLMAARSLGIPVFEGYGLSECASVVSLNSPRADRPGSVGRPLDHVSLRIVDGSIEVSGNVFSGYLGQVERAAADGWLDTGDLGHIDADGFLHITGRRKNLLISSYGRNISPEWVEGELALGESIAQVIVIGDGQPFCAAIVVPRQGADERAVAADIAAANQRLPDYARIRRWLTDDRPFSVADLTLTDNGRPRRDAIAERHCDAIAALYLNADADSAKGIPDVVF